MELTKVIENLTVKSDIGNLDTQSLIDKYCSDEASYKKFLEVFSRVFSNRKVYPIIASFKYRDIEDIIANGQKYSSLATEEAECSILRELYKNEHQFGLDIRGDDYGQALWIFNTEIGADKVKKDSSNFNQKVAKMLESALLFDGSEDTLSRDSVCNFLSDLQTLEKNNYCPDRTEYLVQKYVDENPRIKLCYNNEYLYLTNYIINGHSDCCSQEFLDFTKKIIEISTEIDDCLLVPSDFSKSDYNRLAKFTLQNIDRIEKSRAPLEKPKTKSFNFLKKRPN